MNDEVILPGALHKNPGLDSVVVDDLGSVVGPGIDEPRPRTRIRSRVYSGEPRYPNGRYLLIEQLRAREEVWEVNTVSAAQALAAAGWVGCDYSLAIRVG